MVQLSRPSLEEFLKLPETKPASEFIDGQIIQKPMPQGKHSTIQGDLSATINQILKPHQCRNRRILKQGNGSQRGG
ncbi:Uma2 family endonuclease [Leptolyngbya sp. 7M]|uniref:Uma2 family endonuclease n=1 Tax=Leptolyngbya sp. 7M TaxID=2812896 RepID=UPI002938F906|nr:Uma2 family endonuclease [Leptolyngbya sp. 7M]